MVTAAYPIVHPEYDNPVAQTQMENLIELIKAVRNSRAEANAPMSSAIDIFIKTKSDETKQIFETNTEYIERFCHPKKLEIGAQLVAPKLAITAVITGAEVYLPLADLVNLDEECARLQKEAEKLAGEVHVQKRNLRMNALLQMLLVQ